MIRLKIGIVLCILSVGALTSWAHGITPLDTLRIPISVEVFYRQGHAQFDSTYQNNREKLDCLLEKARIHPEFRSLEGSWVLEDNTAINDLIEDFSGRITKRYRLYRREIDA